MNMHAIQWALILGAITVLAVALFLLGAQWAWHYR
jgi:hypothetical protein